MDEGLRKLVSMKVSIEGEKVQGIGYRIFLLEKALESGMDKIYARNVDKDKVELLVSDEESKVNAFYEIISKKTPEGAIVKHIGKEPHDDKIPIPTVDRYLQFLALEQLSKGREEVVKLPEIIDKTLGPIASTLTGMDKKLEGMDEKLGGMDGKFDKIAERFGVFANYAKGMNEKLDKIATLPEKIDSLPERIAESLGASKKKSKS